LAFLTALLAFAAVFLAAAFFLVARAGEAFLAFFAFDFFDDFLAFATTNSFTETDQNGFVG
jgi:hypothetical protein